MSAAHIVAIIHHLHVVHAIRHKVAKCLVVCFGCELERAVVHLEAVVEACDEVYRTLALRLTVERGVCNAVRCGGVAYLLEERCLIVQTRGKAHRYVLVECRNDAQRQTRAEYSLLRETPVGEAQTVV